MIKTQAEKRIKKLRKLIRQYRYAYHVLNKSLVSDAALDSLKKELFDLEQKFPDLITSDSPTQRVAGKPLDFFRKVSHEVSMISLNDAFSEKDMEDWYERIKGILPSSARIEFYCEHKFDGLAISLQYEKGILNIGSTRGNGLVGEDITQNVKTIESIPLCLLSPKEIVANLQKFGLKEVSQNFQKNFPQHIEVRGEIILNKAEFQRINKEREKAGLSLYANPRNVAAGSVRQLDPKITASRHLSSYIYELITDLGQRTHEEEHLILRSLGFKTSLEDNQKVDSLKGVFNYHNLMIKKREELPYEIDGIVVIVNNNQYFDMLGTVGKAPRGAIAYKFAAEEATTIVKDIIVQVGRTGALTPVAILKPVQLKGTTVSRTTLHNKEEIKRLGLKIGDTVIVSRAGDVIPKVTKVLSELRTGKEKSFLMPSRCPVCGTATIEDESGIMIRCPNEKCPARFQKSIYHFIGRGAFDIQGLGPKLINRLIDEGLIQDAADLFDLKEGDIAELERYGEKSGQNVIAALEKAKNISSAQFLYSLNIRHVGKETALLLARHIEGKQGGKIQIGDLIKIAPRISKEEWENISSIGPKVGETIYQWFQEERNIKFLQKLKDRGIKLISSTSKKGINLQGLNFVFTGSLESLTREDAKQKIEREGGKVSESISSRTSYLVTGKDPGSKYQKAKKLNVKIINEKEFLKMV